jgi:hypothetical protein
MASRKIVFTFLNLSGNIGFGNGQPAFNINAVPLPAAGAVAAPAFDPAGHLWEHDMEKAHLWQIPTVLASSHLHNRTSKAELHYLAWSRAARIDENAPPVHTSFVVPSNQVGTGAFGTHFVHILQNTAGAAVPGSMDVSWDGKVNGIAIVHPAPNTAVTPAVPGAVPFVVQTYDIASAGGNIVDVHIDVTAQPIAGKVLKAALTTAITGKANILTGGGVATELKTRQVVDSIIQSVSNKTPYIWIDDNDQAHGGGGANEKIPENSFIPLVAGGAIANRANGVKPRSILIGIANAGDTTTMFAE